MGEALNRNNFGLLMIEPITWGLLIFSWVWQTNVSLRVRVCISSFFTT